MPVLTTVNFTIDGQSVECESGLTVLAAAKNVGIDIPALCADPRLEPFGACRLCIVEVEGSPKHATACTTKVTEGMKIVTESDKLVSTRKTVLELLLADHPTDCLTCTKVGNCRLQELAYRYGVRESRYYKVPTRKDIVDENKYIGRKQDKCVLCGRCVRVCQEVQGACILDFGNRGFETIVATSFERPLPESDCELCGQCIDACPTGALIDKQAPRSSASLTSYKSTCLMCSIQCTSLACYDSKTGKVEKVKSEAGLGFNDGSLCNSGRWGWRYASGVKYVTRPMIKKGGLSRNTTSTRKSFVPSIWADALDLAAHRIGVVKKEHGPSAVGFLLAPTCSNEEAAAVKELAASIGTSNVGVVGLRPEASLDDISYSGELADTGFSSVDASDLVVVVGSDPIQTHPVLGSFLRQAKNNSGKKIVFVNDNEPKLSRFADVQLSSVSGDDETSLEGIFSELVTALENTNSSAAENVALGCRMIKEAKNPLVLFNPSCGIVEMSALLRRAVTAVGSMKVLDLTLPANSRGIMEAGLVDGTSSVEKILADCESGKIVGLVVIGESRDTGSFLGKKIKSLVGLHTLVVSDVIETELALMSDIILPALSYHKKSGTVTNVEGRKLSISDAPLGSELILDGHKVALELKKRL